MSAAAAELLHRAAMQMDNDHRQDSIYREAETFLEVSRWLYECSGIQANPDVNASLKIAMTDRAIKVARAYLGESA